MHYLITVVIAVTIVVGSRAADELAWPQFRGPDAFGIAEDQKPPVEVGPDKNVKWKIAVPAACRRRSSWATSSSSPLSTMASSYTIAYNRADGREAWRTEAPFTKTGAVQQSPRQPGSPHAWRPTASTSSRTSVPAACFATTSAGNELWKHEMPPAATLRRLRHRRVADHRRRPGCARCAT